MRRQTSWAKAARPDSLFFEDSAWRRGTLPPVVLQKLMRPRASALAHVAGSFNHDRESHIRPRIQIEYQTTGDFRLGRLTVPGMQLEGCDLSDSRQTLNPIDLEVRLAVAKDANKFEQIGRARHRMALEELLTAKAIRGSDD
jgi:hypothetical protein